MTYMTPPPHPSNELVRAGPADARTASVLRDDLHRWLTQAVSVTPVLLSDILTSVYEALANCVDHAYGRRAEDGTMSMHAVYDPRGQRICVSVSDGGTWREPPPTDALDTRGRGLALMRALANQCTIVGRPNGTTVELLYELAMSRV
jgi:serine/threonine-protein kinase RsbW